VLPIIKNLTGAVDQHQAKKGGSSKAAVGRKTHVRSG